MKKQPSETKAIVSPAALARFAAAALETSDLNRIAGEEAISPELAGLRIYAPPPLIGVAAAADPLFRELRRPEVAGRNFRLPEEWLPGAASVISLFFPFTTRVVESNRRDPEWPSPEWLHARIEGQRFNDAFSAGLAERLRSAGFAAVAPALHPEFRVWRRGQAETGEGPDYASNWSERHVAYVAGLGTFGLSAALITRLGVAGRLASVVTRLELPPTPRPYRAYDEYCLYCGACARRCPCLAISREKRRKDRRICAAFLELTKHKYRPRYGCGKCYVNVPCQSGNPAGDRSPGSGQAAPAPSGGPPLEGSPT
ncbi:MAG: epoxyqueuosine reductase [Planctomycetota bacterium]|nr:epoxyqueuosine reductase [Planctomycetota bacterium]